MIDVEAPGLLTTVQDLGRWGYQHLGLGPCGVMDADAARIANLLVGNDWGMVFFRSCRWIGFEARA